MKITKKWLDKHNACQEGIKFCTEKLLINLSLKDFVEKLIEYNKLSYANWLITRSLKKLDCIKYAVYAAELVLPIFEKKYPDDDRPRKAIESVKIYITNKKSAYAAYAAADAAAYVAADAAAYAAAYAAALRSFNFLT